MLSALESVFSVILMIGLGFVLAKRGWFEGKSSSLLSRLVVSVALPAYMISNLMGGYDRATLLSMLPGLPVPFAVMIASFAIATGLAALFRIPQGRRGTFASMFALSNTIFIGLPVNLLLFGEASLSYVLLYYIANTTLFWTLGVYGIARDGSIRSGKPKPSLISVDGLKRILSPPLVAFMAAVAMILIGIELPKSIMDFCKTIGSMTTPLSMLFIGIVIARVEWKKIRLERDYLLVLAGRFLVAPLLLILIVRKMDLPVLMKQVFLIQASMPAMTQTPIMAGAYGADSEYAGVATSLSTVLSLVTIPLFMTVVGIVV
ncbi:MAG: AEC family transporter [Rectinemataceae bacterium]